MKATIDNQTYDTKKAKEICMEPSPDGDDYLYQTKDGRFFLLETEMFLDGVKLRPDQDPDEIAPELDVCNFKVPLSEIEAQQRARIRCYQKIRPLSDRAALVWCVKTQIPACFRGYVLDAI
jgi:hypothetical protein